MITKKLSLWWLMFVLQVVFFAIGVSYNLHIYFWLNDYTYISELIVAIWAIFSMHIGYNTYKGIESNEASWFAADSCMTLGMLGTVIGFVVMLADTFTAIDPQNIESMRAAIAAMSAGMSTALLTTLAGLVCALFLKMQLVNQDSGNAKT